jgi:UDP-N-acetylmuramyl pentapeptide phosphotransferase/UDP-N-acetylglucosamine-1-phosphate transferase
MVPLGGVSIFAGTFISLLIVWWLGGFVNMAPDKEWQLWSVIIGSLALAIAGIPSGMTYACASTSLLSFAIWRVWKLSRQS